MQHAFFTYATFALFGKFTGLPLPVPARAGWEAGWLAVSFFEGGQNVKMYSKEEHRGSETTVFFFVLS